jgi:hypothetical protein
VGYLLWGIASTPPPHGLALVSVAY